MVQLIIEGNLEVKLPTIFMDRWKSRGGESQRRKEQKGEDQRNSEKRKGEKKEDAGARKGSFSNHVWLPTVEKLAR